MGEVLLYEREEHFSRAGHEEEHAASEVSGASVAGGFGEAIETVLLIGDQGHDGVGEDAHRDARPSESFDSFETEFGARRARFELACEGRVERGDGDVHAY